MSEQRGGWVLVTGANGGIGRAVCSELARAGYGVLAAVHRASRDAAERSGRVRELTLDLTRAEDIGELLVQLDRLGAGALAGVVHNAGIALPGAFELAPLEETRLQIETNVFGTLQLTHALLSRLRASRGRIIVITSVAGRMPMPFNAVHCATKHFLEGMFSSLRIELRAAGIETVLIEPGTIKTPMIDKFSAAAERALGRVPPELYAIYGRPLRAMVARMRSHIAEGSSPEVVARSVVHALAARKPRAHYAVGREARRLTLAARLLPDRAKDRLMTRLLDLPARAHA